MASPNCCCICQEPPRGKARACGSCGDLTCSACLRAYVQKSCVTGVKCPTFACAERVTEDELEALFCKSFVVVELKRLRRRALKEADGKHFQVTNVVYMPVVNRLLGLVPAVKRARDAKVDVVLECGRVAKELFCVMSAAFKPNLPVAYFGGSPREFFDSQLRPALSYTGVHSYQYDEVRSLGPSVVAAVAQRWPRICALLGDRLDALNANIEKVSCRGKRDEFSQWSSDAMRFAAFANALFKSWAEAYMLYDYRALDALFAEGLDEFDRRGGFEGLVLAWEACHSYPQAYARLEYLVTLAGLFLDAVRKPAAYVGSFDPSLLAPLGAAYDDPFFSGVNWRQHQVVLGRVFSAASASSGMSREELAVRRWNCASSGCKGSFTEARPACNTCDAAHCETCHERLEADHVCSAESVASVNLITSTTRPCPRCASSIDKVRETCEQMFCTVCSTLFEFSTGKLVSKTAWLHNPHYMALSKEAREAVRRAMPASGDAAPPAAAAPADVARFQCMRVDDRDFHNVFQEVSASNADLADPAACVTQGRVLDELREWETMQRSTSQLQLKLADRPENDMVARVSLLTGLRFRDATKEFNEWGGYDGAREVGPAFNLKRYTEADYLKHLDLSASARRRSLALAVNMQSLLDVARDLLIGAALERDARQREVLLGALAKLRLDFQRARKRKATVAAEAAV